MQTGLWFLFVAFAVVWAVLFGYLASLRARQQRLEVELRSLDAALGRREGETDAPAGTS